MNNAIPKLASRVSDARIAWNLLNGVFAVYKPSAVTYLNTRDTIIYRICEDLNSMKVRPPRQHVCIEGDTTKSMRVIIHPSYADHPLVVGPRYQPQDFKVACANYLSTDTSGLMICGINSGTRWVNKLKDSKSPASYRVKGIFGQATDNYFKTGKIVERSTYKYIKRRDIDRICAAMQAAHQRKMFESSGVHIQSQAAYELATQGLMRPVDKNIPTIYTIKCTDFKSPEFILEIVCINENDMYLKTLVHEIGMQLHSVATCTFIQCFRYALFDMHLALLRKHWELQNILENIELCDKVLRENGSLLNQTDPILKKPEEKREN